MTGVQTCALPISQTIMSADRVIVLKAGRVVANLPTDDFDAIRRVMKGDSV
mgnify:CR=1 FL=1